MLQAKRTNKERKRNKKEDVEEKYGKNRKRAAEASSINTTSRHQPSPIAVVIYALVCIRADNSTAAAVVHNSSTTGAAAAAAWAQASRRDGLSGDLLSI